MLKALFPNLFRVADCKRGESLPCRNIPEILLHHFHRGGSIQVTCQHEDGIAGLVVLAVMLVRHLAGQIHDVARPADGRHAVRESLVYQGIERLEKAARGLVVVTHAAFFAHHVAFGVELAQNRILHAVGFEPHEKFNLVFRERHDVGRHQVRRKRIEAGTAHRLVSAPEFVLHKELALFIQEGIVFSGKLFDGSRIARKFRRADKRLQAVFTHHESRISNAVSNAHLVGALEKFMFQDMRQARLARDFVHGTCHIKQAAAHRRGLLVRVQQHRKPVRQNFLMNIQFHFGMGNSTKRKHRGSNRDTLFKKLR